MNKNELLQRLDGMIHDQERHLRRLESNRVGKVRNWFFPKINKMIDEFLTNGRITLNHLKQRRKEYDDYDFG
jgi:hypothetical protein